MKIKKGDTVIVIAGNDKGKQGEVVKVLPKENRVVVKGVNIRIRHKKEQQTAGMRGTQGGKIEFEAPIHASNVMLVDPKTGKPTRVSYKIDGDSKVRIAQKSGNELN
jgi:large subunit ribosomal protein L24